MQATTAAPSQPPASETASAPRQPPEESGGLAGDLFALISYLHKNCTSDLFEAVGGVDLSLSQIKLLHQLDDRSRELTLKQAAEAVHVSLPAASRMVDDLVTRGFVERNEDVEDRRMKRVRITDAGGEVVRHLNEARLIGLEKFVESLNAGERRALGQLLAKLLHRPDVAASRPTDRPDIAPDRRDIAASRPAARRDIAPDRSDVAASRSTGKTRP